MVLATLMVSGRGWLWPAIGLAFAGLLLLVWAYRRALAEGWVRGVCLGLKLLGLLALASCLLEPLWTGQRARPGANYFVVLADNSQSLQIKDRHALRTRGETLRRLLDLKDNPAWQAKLEQDFQVRRYLFDARLQPTRDFSELSFDGRASALQTALRTLADRFKGQPLAGVLVLTDGNATDLDDRPLPTAGLPPIYPVVLGTDDPIRDLAITKVQASQTAFEDAPVHIQANVAAVGYAGEGITAQLIELGQSDGGPAVDSAQTNLPPRPTNSVPSAASSAPKSAAQGKIVAEQTLPAPPDDAPLAFRFQVRPSQHGLVFYRVRVAARGELDQFDQPGSSTEAILGNNTRMAVVDRGQGPYRILYVAGRPNWEYKFLNRALADDEQLQLVALLRVAKREPKFDFRSRPGETSNPLFRGFDGPPQEEGERYDQPVLVRLNVRDEHELRGGFPRAPEDLFAYHAVVLDDLEAEFFTADQMLLLQKFVSERGGGLLMLGGAESFQQGKYARTPVGDLLPVYLDAPSEPVPARQWRLALTREGWLTPWVRLRQLEAEERARLEAMPPFQVLNRVGRPKPGASLLATASDGRGAQFPALAVQRFGRGRTAALMIGDLWRWGFREETLHRDMDKAWRQLLRWLVTDTPDRVELLAEALAGDPNQAVVLQVRARDRQFQPLDNATVVLHVRPVGQARSTAPPADGPGSSRPLPSAAVAQPAGRGTTAALRLSAEPAVSEAGLYQATYVPRTSGAYHAEAVVTDAQAMEVGRAVTGWTSDPAADEFRSLKPNRAWLEDLARQTGGRMVAAEKLEEFARLLPSLKAPITESWSYPLWHQAGVFAFALLCLLAEWGLRRLKGLP